MRLWSSALCAVLSQASGRFDCVFHWRCKQRLHRRLFDTPQYALFTLPLWYSGWLPPKWGSAKRKRGKNGIRYGYLRYAIHCAVLFVHIHTIALVITPHTSNTFRLGLWAFQQWPIQCHDLCCSVMLFNLIKTQARHSFEFRKRICRICVRCAVGAEYFHRNAGVKCGSIVFVAVEFAFTLKICSYLVQPSAQAACAPLPLRAGGGHTSQMVHFSWNCIFCILAMENIPNCTIFVRFTSIQSSG